jgi:hypothetical protein
MTTEIHDLAHRWQTGPSEPWAPIGPWDCPHCLLSSSVAFDALCPDLVAAAMVCAAQRDTARREFWSLAAVSLVCILTLAAVVIYA